MPPGDIFTSMTILSSIGEQPLLILAEMVQLPSFKAINFARVAVCSTILNCSLSKEKTGNEKQDKSLSIVSKTVSAALQILVFPDNFREVHRFTRLHKYSSLSNLFGNTCQSLSMGISGTS